LGLACELQQVSGEAHGGSIEETGAAWNQSEVRCPDGFKGGILAASRGIDHGEVCTCLGSGLEGDAKSGRLNGFHGRSLGLAQVAPSGGASLGIKVDHHGGFTGQLGGNSKVNGNRGFAGPSFLTNDNDGLHSSTLPASSQNSKIFCYKN